MTTIYFTATEIAKMLKISKALAYRLIAHGDLPSLRFGRTVRVRQEDLDAFIASNSSKSELYYGNTKASLSQTNQQRG